MAAVQGAFWFPMFTASSVSMVLLNKVCVPCVRGCVCCLDLTHARAWTLTHGTAESVLRDSISAAILALVLPKCHDRAAQFHVRPGEVARCEELMLKYVLLSRVTTKYEVVT
jgi:hypothetical protein